MANGVNVYFEYRNSQRVMLPVNPASLQVERRGNNETETIVDYGDINILQRPGLRRVEIESFIPTVSGGSYIERGTPLYSPQFYIDFFTAISEQMEPVTLVVTGLGVTIDMAIEDFEYSWEAPDQDMHFVLSLAEYRPYTMRTIEKEVQTDPSPLTDTQSVTPRENTPKKLAVGVTVLVNGILHSNSYGGNEVIERNQTRKISHLYTDGRPYPIHVVRLTGGNRGWVTAADLQVIE